MADIVIQSCWALKTNAARHPPTSCGTKCIHESSTLSAPEVISDIVTAGLKDAPEIDPTERAPASTTKAFAAELLFTFALAYVILKVATSETTEGNGFYGAAIALVVLAGALSVGSISGGSFNPAVTVSMIASGVLSVEDSWIHFIPQLVGGCLAALVFKAQRV